MHRAVLDTSVLVSGILFGGTSRRPLEAMLRGELKLVTSDVLLEELEELLARKFAFTREAAREVRAELEALADVVRPDLVPEVCRDPDDDHVLAAALTGASLIVTGDSDLLALECFGPVRITSPANFAAEMDRG